jgi:phage-related protein
VAEYRQIVEELEISGRLEMPFGEKVSGALFAIRVIQAGNIRVFYVYGIADEIYGIYGYVKTTRAIPQKEMNHADKIIKLLRKEGLIK